MAGLVRFYRAGAFSAVKLQQLTATANAKLKANGSATVLERVEAELCYYLEFESGTSLAGLTDERECAGGRDEGGPLLRPPAKIRRVRAAAPAAGAARQAARAAVQFGAPRPTRARVGGASGGAHRRTAGW